MYKPLVAQRVDGRLTITTQEAAERAGRRSYTYPLPGRLVRLVFRNLSEELQLYEYTIVNSERKASQYGEPDARYPLSSGFFSRLFGGESVALFYRLAPDLLDERAVHLTDEETAEVKATIPAGDEMNFHDYTLAYGISDTLDVIGTRSIDDIIGVLERTGVRKVQDFNEALVILSEILVTLDDKLELSISSTDEDLIDLSVKNSISFFEPPRKRRPKRKPVAPDKKADPEEKESVSEEKESASEEMKSENPVEEEGLTISVNTGEVKEMLRKQEEPMEPVETEEPLPIGTNPDADEEPSPEKAQNEQKRTTAELMGDIFDTAGFKAIAAESIRADEEPHEDKLLRDRMLEERAREEEIHEELEAREDAVDETSDVPDDTERENLTFGQKFLRLIGIEVKESPAVEWEEDDYYPKHTKPKRRFSLFEDSIEEMEREAAKNDELAEQYDDPEDAELAPLESQEDIPAEELPDDLQYEPRREGEQIVIGNQSKLPLDSHGENDIGAIKKQYPAKKSKKKKSR